MMVENSFKGYIGIFIFYILLINYTIFMRQILIFLPGSKRQMFILVKKLLASRIV